jgi:hypothetical protein
MQIIAKKKFANLLDMVCIVPYTYDISQTKGKKMATNYTTLKLTDNEILALCKWVALAQESEYELVHYDPSDKQAAKRVKALESIERKIEKEGWE